MKKLLNREKPKRGVEYIEEMSKAVVAATGHEYFEQLSDVQLHAYVDLFWAFHKDLQDEWVRRKMAQETKRVLDGVESPGGAE